MSDAFLANQIQVRNSDEISIAPTRKYKVSFECEGGNKVTVTFKDSSISNVIDKVNHRRVAVPPNMLSFSVSEVNDAT